MYGNPGTSRSPMVYEYSLQRFGKYGKFDTTKDDVSRGIDFNSKAFKIDNYVASTSIKDYIDTQFQNANKFDHEAPKRNWLSLPNNLEKADTQWLQWGCASCQRDPCATLCRSESIPLEHSKYLENLCSHRKRLGNEPEEEDMCSRPGGLLLPTVFHDAQLPCNTSNATAAQRGNVGRSIRMSKGRTSNSVRKLLLGKKAVKGTVPNAWAARRLNAFFLPRTGIKLNCRWFKQPRSKTFLKKIGNLRSSLRKNWRMIHTLQGGVCFLFFSCKENLKLRSMLLALANWGSHYKHIIDADFERAANDKLALSSVINQYEFDVAQNARLAEEYKSEFHKVKLKEDEARNYMAEVVATTKLALQKEKEMHANELKESMRECERKIQTHKNQCEKNIKLADATFAEKIKKLKEEHLKAVAQLKAKVVDYENTVKEERKRRANETQEMMSGIKRTEAEREAAFEALKKAESDKKCIQERLKNELYALEKQLAVSEEEAARRREQAVNLQMELSDALADVAKARRRAQEEDANLKRQIETLKQELREQQTKTVKVKSEAADSEKETQRLQSKSREESQNQRPFSSTKSEVVAESADAIFSEEKVSIVSPKEVDNKSASAPTALASTQRRSVQIAARDMTTPGSAAAEVAAFQTKGAEDFLRMAFKPVAKTDRATSSQEAPLKAVEADQGKKLGPATLTREKMAASAILSKEKELEAFISAREEGLSAVKSDTILATQQIPTIVKKSSFGRTASLHKKIPPRKAEAPEDLEVGEITGNDARSPFEKFPFERISDISAREKTRRTASLDKKLQVIQKKLSNLLESNEFGRTASRRSLVSTRRLSKPIESPEFQGRLISPEYYEPFFKTMSISKEATKKEVKRQASYVEPDAGRQKLPAFETDFDAPGAATGEKSIISHKLDVVKDVGAQLAATESKLALLKLRMSNVITSCKLVSLQMHLRRDKKFVVVRSNRRKATPQGSRTRSSLTATDRRDIRVEELKKFL